jgi:hypothetical protein
MKEFQGLEEQAECLRYGLRSLERLFVAELMGGWGHFYIFVAKDVGSVFCMAEIRRVR